MAAAHRGSMAASRRGGNIIANKAALAAKIA